MEQQTGKPDTPSGSYVKNRRRAGQFLESKGFGWLMEEEDADQEDIEPLLYVYMYGVTNCFIISKGLELINCIDNY